MDKVVNAIRILNASSSEKTQRIEADQWLRQWQQSPDAWQMANLLLDGNFEYEVQHLAATTLRTKILYDFIQIPTSEHNHLLETLLRKLVSKRQYVPVFSTLALAVADMTIYLCHSYPEVVKFVIDGVSKQEDYTALIYCLQVLPEENESSVILADPVNVKKHSEILLSYKDYVIEQLTKGIKQYSNEPQILISIYKCFNSWNFFVKRKTYFSVPEIFINSVLQCVSSKVPDLSDTALETLSEILSGSRSWRDSDKYKLKRIFNELAQEKGLIWTALQENLQDEMMLSQLASVYKYTCLSYVPELSTLIRNSLIDNTLQILIMLTEIPFSFHSEYKGVDGIAAKLLNFWENFAIYVYKQRLRFNASHKDTNDYSDGENLDPTEPDKIQQLICCQNMLLNTLLQKLFNHMKLPLELITGEHCGDVEDYYEFRSLVCDVIQKIGFTISMNNLFDQLVQISSTNPDEITMEAFISTLAALLSNGVKIHLYADIFHSVLDKFDPILSNTINLDTSPAVLTVNLHLRISACTYIQKLAKRIPFMDNAPLVFKCAQMLGFQIFMSKRLQENVEIENLGYKLIDKASEAFNQLCTTFQTFYIMQDLAQHFIAALKTFQPIDEKSYCNVLQGTTILVSRVSSDEQFAKYFDDLTEDIIQQLSTSKNNLDLILQLDRISVILMNLNYSQAEKMSLTRREKVASFVQQKLWIVFQHYLSSPTSPAMLIEKCGRSMKHALRCLGQNLFQPLVKPIADLLLQNIKKKLYPTYLYMAEWLIEEYRDCNEICALLKILFYELSTTAFENIQRIQDIKTYDASNLIEDFYAMFCRYFRYCPSIPLNAPTLSQAIEMAFVQFHHPSPDVISVICVFFVNLIDTARPCSENEEGLIITQESTITQQKLQLNFAIRQMLPRLCVELFTVIKTIPPYMILEKIADVLYELRTLDKPDYFQDILAGNEQNNIIIQLRFLVAKITQKLQ